MTIASTPGSRGVPLLSEIKAMVKALSDRELIAVASVASLNLNLLAQELLDRGYGVGQVASIMGLKYGRVSAIRNREYNRHRARLHRQSHSRA